MPMAIGVGIGAAFPEDDELVAAAELDAAPAVAPPPLVVPDPPVGVAVEEATPVAVPAPAVGQPCAVNAVYVSPLASRAELQIAFEASATSSISAAEQPPGVPTLAHRHGMTFS
jgi:hypothetical protein